MKRAIQIGAQIDSQRIVLFSNEVDGLPKILM